MKHKRNQVNDDAFIALVVVLVAFGMGVLIGRISIDKKLTNTYKFVDCDCG